MFPADVLYFQLKMAQILRIRRTTFGFEDGPRPVHHSLNLLNDSEIKVVVYVDFPACIFVLCTSILII